jgi:anti-sigma B factor antagonist
MAMTDEPDDVGAVSVSAEDGAVVVQLTGEIDISNVDAFRETIAGAVGPTSAVVFDMSGVAFMDTSGLALLIDVANTASSCELRAPTSQVRRVVEASGLSDVLRMEP